MARDPIELEIFKNIFHSVAEEMGAALRRTAFSPNIKERRDYSCAVFDSGGEVLAMGDHMPVHLGSMPMSVRAVLERLELTRMSVARIPAPWASAARSTRRDSAFLQWNARETSKRNWPPVTPEQNACAKSANGMGVRTLFSRIASTSDCIFPERSSFTVPSNRAIHAPPASSAASRAEDFLDNDGISDRPVKLAVEIRVARERKRPGNTVTVDFTGSDSQVEGSVNAVEAITYSACFYVFRCLLMEDVPATAGLMRPIRVIAAEGTVVNARPPAAVAGGNVETSQRIVDVLLKALSQALPNRIPAAASGTMNNLTIGGIDPHTHEPFAYYETIAGGMGARPGKAGVSGVHTHMTNSLNTPAEALEYAYPLRVRTYSLRPDSGGAGKHRGGDGIVREIEVLTDAEVTLLADRRTRAPYGLNGGANGVAGKATVTRADGSSQPLPGKSNVRLRKGERIRIETPGGGGWGEP